MSPFLGSITSTTITLCWPRGLKQLGIRPGTNLLIHPEGLCSNLSFQYNFMGFTDLQGGFPLIILDWGRMRDLCLLPRLPNTYTCCLDASSRQGGVLCVYILSDKEIYVLFAAMTVRELGWHKCLQKDEWIGPFGEQGCQETEGVGVVSASGKHSLAYKLGKSLSLITVL